MAVQTLRDIVKYSAENYNSRTAYRYKVKKEIVDKTSVIEEGRGVCFSMPVTQVYGLAGVKKQKKQQLKKAKLLSKKETTK